MMMRIPVMVMMMSCVMLLIMPMVMMMSCVLFSMMSMEIFHVMIVIFMCFIQYHIEITGINARFLNSFHLYFKP